MTWVLEGRIRSKDLARLYSEHLGKGSMICTDSYKSYIQFSKNQNIEHIIIHSTTKFLHCIIKHYQGREPIFM